MRLRQKHKTLHTGDGKRRDGSDDGSESDTESEDDDDGGGVGEGDEHTSGAEGEAMYTDDKPANGADKDGSGEESDADTSHSDGRDSSDESEASAGQKAHPSLDPPRLVTVKVHVNAINALALLPCQPVPQDVAFFVWAGQDPNLLNQALSRSYQSMNAKVVTSAAPAAPVAPVPPAPAAAAGPTLAAAAPAPTATASAAPSVAAKRRRLENGAAAASTASGKTPAGRTAKAGDGPGMQLRSSVAQRPSVRLSDLGGIESCLQVCRLGQADQRYSVAEGSYTYPSP